MHSQKDRKLAPAKDARKDIHKMSQNPHKKSWPTAERINRSQRKRQVVRTSACTYRSSLGGKLTSNPSGKASFAENEQPKAQRISPKDHRFYQRLISGLFDDLPDAGTDTVTHNGDRLAALATVKTAGARRSRLSITSSPVTKRVMPHLVISSMDRQRSCCPHQLTLEIDGYDHHDAAPLGSNAINDDGKSNCVDILTIRRDAIFANYYFQAFSSLGQLACRDIAAIWIKCCHSKKQTRYPYKGRSRTKPDYWPSSDHWEAGLGCRHIEPAHLKKSERLFLLRHLLCYGGQFCIEKLQESTNKILVSCVNHWTPTKIAALDTIYAIRRKEIEFKNGASGRSLVDWIARFRAGQRPYDCDTEIDISEYNLETVNTRNIQRSTEYPNAKLEIPHENSRAHTPQPTVVANAGIQPSGTLIDPEAGIERRDREKTDKPETITIEGASAIISTPKATEGSASQVEMSMPSPRFPTQQQHTRISSSQFPHSRLLINSSSPMLSWEQSMYAEEPLFKSEPMDCQRQTSNALSHVASRLWTSDRLGYIRGDDMVPYPSRTDVVGCPPDMPAIEVQQHTSLPHPLAPMTSGFLGSSSDLAGLDSYWHAPITVPSGMSGQQYDASHYPSWDNESATANTSFGGDFTENSRLCFSNAGFPSFYNQTQGEAIQNQYTACLSPGFGNPSVNLTYPTKASDGISGQSHCL